MLPELLLTRPGVQLDKRTLQSFLEADPAIGVAVGPFGEQIFELRRQVFLLEDRPELLGVLRGKPPEVRVLLGGFLERIAAHEHDEEGGDS